MGLYTWRSFLYLFFKKGNFVGITYPVDSTGVRRYLCILLLRIRSVYVIIHFYTSILRNYKSLKYILPPHSFISCPINQQMVMGPDDAKKEIN